MPNTYFMWTLEKLQEFWDDHISELFARKNSVYTKSEIDTKTAALEGAMAVVQSTDTATVAISSGQYVLWKGSLYTASSAIAIDDTLSLSNLTAVTSGGFNALDSARVSGDTALGGRVDLVNGAMAIVATGDVAPKAISEGQYVLWGGVLHTANSAIADGATLTVSNLTAVTDGGFNALNDGLTSLNSKLVKSISLSVSISGGQGQIAMSDIPGTVISAVDGQNGGWMVMVTNGLQSKYVVDVLDIVNGTITHPGNGSRTIKFFYV